MDVVGIYRSQGAPRYLISAPSGVPEDVNDWTPAAQTSVETIVTSSRVVVILEREKMRNKSFS